MLIGFFRKSYFFQYVVLIFLAGLLWLQSFIQPPSHDFSVDFFLMPGYSLINSLLSSSAFLTITFAFSILLIEAFLINYMLIKNELVPKNTLIPAMVYIILFSHSKSLLQLHPVLISNLFLIIIIYNMFSVYNVEEAYSKIFNAGFVLAIASFFYYPVIYFIFFIWFAFIVYRLYKWREWLIPLTGLITPYIFLFTYYLWSDDLIPALDSFSNYYAVFTISPTYHLYTFFDWIIAGFIILFFMWSFLWLISNVQERTIIIRKRYWTIFWLLFIALVTYIGSGEFAITHIGIVLIPVVIYMSYGFSQVRRKFWYELLFGSFVFIIIINNLKGLFF